MNSKEVSYYHPGVVKFAYSRPLQLEREYFELYGQEFVDDLTFVFHLMKRDIRRQPAIEEIMLLRQHYHEEGDRKTLFFIDFGQDKLVSMTIDEFGNKTMHVFEDSPVAKPAGDKTNVRYLLSGMCYYSKDQAKQWLNKLLGPGEMAWYGVS